MIKNLKEIDLWGINQFLETMDFISFTHRRYFSLGSVYEIRDLIADEGLEVLKYLRAKGFIRRATDTYYFATDYGRLDIIKESIAEESLDMFVNQSSGYFYRWAAKNGHLEFLRYFVERRKNDIYLIRFWDNRALRWACENGHLEVVKYLISVGLGYDDLMQVYNSTESCIGENGYAILKSELEKLKRS